MIVCRILHFNDAKIEKGEGKDKRGSLLPSRLCRAASCLRETKIRERREQRPRPSVTYALFFCTSEGALLFLSGSRKKKLTKRKAALLLRRFCRLFGTQTRCHTWQLRQVPHFTPSAPPSLNAPDANVGETPAGGRQYRRATARLIIRHSCNRGVVCRDAYLRLIVVGGGVPSW